MQEPNGELRGSAAGYVLMLLVILWSGALAAGFAWAAMSGELSAARTAAFWAVSAFLALLASRTGYELVRKAVRSTLS